MKLFNTTLMGVLLTCTVVTFAQAAPSRDSVKVEAINHHNDLATGCTGWDPRACGKQ